MILKCWHIAEWMQLIDKLGQQEAVMVVIMNKVASRQGLWYSLVNQKRVPPHCPHHI